MYEMDYEQEQDSGRIREFAFCREFLRNRQLCSLDGVFYTPEGRVTNENILRKEIYDQLAKKSSGNLSRKVDTILDNLRLACQTEQLPCHVDRIHVANGTYFLPEGFTPEKDFCRHRLPVNFNEDAPEPTVWLSFLRDLLEPEDIETLQEFMGYCLIPTTVAQKMLLITGRGGEGKSRIGIVMRMLLGDNMKNGSIVKVENNPFARADLEHQLLMVDDDLRLEGLNGTSYLKSIITAEQPMDLERKNVQSYQGMLYVRFMAFGNGTLQAIHDQSNGFFRRQIILSAKQRPADRVDDPYLTLRLKGELEGIFNWVLMGLFRLIGNDFKFTISKQARRNLLNAMARGSNVVEFLRSKGYFLLDPQGCCSSRILYQVYLDWCEDNSLMPMSKIKFWEYLSQNAALYGISHSRNIPIGNGKFARGFQGIKTCPRF